MRLTAFILTTALTAAAFPGFAAVTYRKTVGKELFHETNLPRISITISTNDLGRLRQGSAEYVPADLTVNGQRFRPVGVRLKGHGSFQALGAKPSLAVKMDAFTPAQRLFGLSKILLNNAGQDSSLMSEFLTSALFSDANVPAARIGHARVELNGRDRGFYVVAEAMNKAFLRRHFPNPDGNLYEAYARDITGPLEQDGGEPSDQSDIRRLEAVASRSGSERAGRLHEVLDVDTFLSFLAITMLSSQHDSYPLNRNNYRLYADPVSGKFVMLPHGIDGSFSRTHLPLLPPRNYLLTQAVLDTEEQRRIYRERVALLFTNVFRLEMMSNRVQTAIERLQTGAKDDVERAAIARQGSSFLRRVAQRHRAVALQLSGNTIPVLTVDHHTPVPATEWYEEVNKGSATFSRTEVEGSLAMCIQAGVESSVASWRKSITLAPGDYRFEARVRVTNISGTSPSGAALRISGKPAVKSIANAEEWAPLQFSFTVSQEAPDVILICELRGSDGQTWFAIDSLKLTRER